MSVIDLHPPEWQERAACNDGGVGITDEFFPTKGGSVLYPKSICARCEVRTECLRFAIDNDIEHGVFGGLSAHERDVSRRAEKAAS